MNQAWDLNAWEWVARIELLLMTPVVAAFALLYGLFWPWYRSAQGRALLLAKAGLALLLVFWVLYLSFEEYLPPREYMAVVLYGVLLAGQVGMLVALLRSWRYRHDRDNTPKEERL